MNSYVLDFQELDKTKLDMAGGKGANLGELSRIGGIQVPSGFCVTTNAYKEITCNNEKFNTLLNRLSGLKCGSIKDTGDICAEIRRVIESTVIPNRIETEIVRRLEYYGADNAYAVRSSATAEDLPTASFAGQQDTYLNIIGKEAVVKHILKCWASLFTDRAVIYRIQNGFEHDKVNLSVVIQRMVFSESAGIMFTADPVTSNRRILSIDASFALGEALVSGLVNADNYKVRDGRILDKKISEKKLAVLAVKGGGTRQCEISDEQRNKQTLTDDQILALSKIGRKIESHFDCPQDIEWCLSGDKFYIVQSRPITTLFPMITSNDGKNHIYLCMGHSQMMTDAMKPLGLTFFPLFIEKLGLPNAGGRIYMDCAPDLSSPISRKIFTKSMKAADPYSGAAFAVLIKRKKFMKNLANGTKSLSFKNGHISWRMPAELLKVYLKKDSSVVGYLFRRSEEMLGKMEKTYAEKYGVAVVADVRSTLNGLRGVMYDSKIMAALFAGLMAQSWLNKKLKKWVGIERAGDFFLNRLIIM